MGQESKEVRGQEELDKVMEQAQQAARLPEDGPEDQSCPRCGFSRGVAPRPMEEDLQEYLRCVLGGLPFHKRYELHGGAVMVGFRSLSNREVDRMSATAALLPQEPDNAQARALETKLRLLYFLETLQLDRAEASEYTPPQAAMGSFAEIDAEFDKRFGALDETLVRALTQVLMLFMDLQGLLVVGGFDENFWKGAGLRSR
jgi:hypothetical protein